jgi:aspartate/methionine/tyrosine aminotransferase
VGAAQANWMVCSTLLEPGDEVVVVSPGYRQVWGLAKNLGCQVKEAQLCPGNNWRLDLDVLESLVTAKTRLVSIVNPNNPTGSILSHADMLKIVSICQKVGAWLHADEVYRGTEMSDTGINGTGMNGGETPSFWGMYDRTLCVNSMSKAYGLAGLRIGWVVASPKMIEELWRRHEYAVIAASGPSMTLAEIALQPAKRQMLLERQRKLSREGHAILEVWVRQQDGKFSVSPAVATSIAFVQYQFDMPSVELANHIREKVSVLVAPGAYLGTENHLRITVGYEPKKVMTALERIGSAVAELVGTAARR